MGYRWAISHWMEIRVMSLVLSQVKLELKLITAVEDDT
jgi:hypothetical protein